jgi:hypothetical protein
MMADVAAYTGAEAAVPASAVRAPASADYFQISAMQPPGAVPIIDDDTDTVIGFRAVVGGNVWTYDLAGHVIGIDEPPLGTPLIDPIDLIMIVGAIGRLFLRSMIRAGVEAAGELGARGAVRGISIAAAAELRYAFRRLVQRELQFTATTAARMAEPGRFVPVNILKLAVRFGVREADPQGVPGAFQYTIKMFKGAKRLGDPAREYVPRVVVRERDWTVLHFDYSR